MVNTSSKNNDTEPVKGTRKGRAKPSAKNDGPRGPRVVTWPKEYTEYASHPVQHALCRAYNFGGVKGVYRKAAKFLVSNVVPTDRDHEYYDGVTNQYKILKSLTSGARFYNQNTLFALKLNYRSCVIRLARAVGLMNALTAKLQVENAPAYGAWNLMRHGIATNYLTEIENLPLYRQKLAEAVSELNSIPMPNEGGLDDFFRYYSHVYRDDHGLASDYYLFVPINADTVGYDDGTTGSGGVPGHMTTITHSNIENSGIASLLDGIITTCNQLRASLDINNLMSDLINVFPSSRYDWAGVISKHAAFEAAMDARLATAISSAPMTLQDVTAMGTVSAAGDTVEFLGGNLGNAPANWKSHISDDQWVDTKAGASEVSCYDFQVTVNGSGSGGAITSTDRVDTTGFILTNLHCITDIGTPTSAPNKLNVYTLYANSNSTVQSDAEEGGKRLGIIWIQFKALPKLDMYNYGASTSDDDLFWNPEDIRLVAKVDLQNNIKVFNMVRSNTTHLTTEKQR